MTDMTQLDEALALALKLSPKERIRLIEQVASSVERDIEVPAPSEGHWGQGVNALFDSLDMSEWEAVEMDDPVVWVEQLRTDERRQRLGNWGEQE
ncbi:MAG: hypothetical protein H7Y09_15555 [Chitinophagaceae bacterium]|nr:hypothetical protein [Anaerolineae bacterium]